MCEKNKERTGWRENVEEFLELMKEKRVPLLILSAGLGDVIDCLFEVWFGEKYEDIMYTISNFLLFDEETGIAKLFKGDTIHIYNKKEVKVLESDFGKKFDIQQRRNVILVGDSEGDIHMAEGIDHDCVLKVGFLNKNSEEALKHYSEIFDIVLVEDFTFNFINDILKELK